ncbi:MAG: ATP synthase F1 subunit gamma [Clostridia bacterium]|jgi:F-type H+-transporting ATPase subunit gamma|nr:ATP synthase F1 subunit gamma [Clostridia bacterium]MBQ3860096.1 ATP synthase F1 subunit gamma [Clostridia bacterium]MBQ3956912.1 ATP synthase F1 subunit gamma [Clostridia bacterium]MBQ5356190.1 ATP synthase F1 subunit gamma [Clostridia bacterium]MBR4186527.1 ATP synthase F1 subunit gamma [Clostridia bacterium]
MGANTKAIRARIRSVDSTRHITKAMELVASSKIRRAAARMESSRFYRDVMLDAFADLSAEKSVYARQRARELPALYIVIAGDRGLAGGYNSNIFRSAMTMIRPTDFVLPVGKRAVDYYTARKTFKVLTPEFASVERFTSGDAAKIAYRARDLYENGEIGAVSLISTKFVSMLSQKPDITYLLPLEVLAENRHPDAGKETEEPKDGAAKPLTEYEPNAEEVLAAIIPEYLSGVLYTSVTEAFASELAARRAAMDSATKNADEMLENLSLKYNQARQSAITQEITEIVAGAGV